MSKAHDRKKPVQLLVIRHALAKDKQKFSESGEPDTLRPLTKTGRKQMVKAAKGLKQLVPDLALLATSPLTRAVETAEIVQHVFKNLKSHSIDELKPDQSPERFLRWLLRQTNKKTVAVVGHEPHLSGLVSWLISGRRGEMMALEKGGACLLEFPNSVGPGGGKLIWLMSVKQLKKFR